PARPPGSRMGVLASTEHHAHARFPGPRTVGTGSTKAGAAGRHLIRPSITGDRTQPAEARAGEAQAGVSAQPAAQTLTFLFTDLEGSTRRWEQFPQAMRAALQRHDAILRDAVEGSQGRIVKATGDGMLAVFPSAVGAVSATLAAQRGLAAEPWGETGALRVRMALHSGEAEARGGDYFGPTVNRAARIMAAGHGGQVLLSGATAALVSDERPAGSTLRDLGEHRLKDLERPERLFQLVHPDLTADFPPLVTLNRRPNNLPTQTSAFVGRDGELEEVRR